MRRILVFCLLFLGFQILTAKVQFILKNSGYAYNGENGEYWEETRDTITYFEDLVQPYFLISFSSNVEFKLGAGFLVPFNQEEKIKNYYPYVQSKLYLGDYTLVVGSLDGAHNFPPPILDPLVNLTPQVRVLTASQIPIPYEYFPDGIYSHGLYEYGGQLEWKALYGKGELYMNWQLPDTVNHRERFDVGLIHSYDPFYSAFHYWHNGGHENPHPIAITENYTAAAGLRNETYSILYVASYFIPDREKHPEKNVFGEGLYLEYNFYLFDFQLQFQGFASDQFWADNHQFISVEGDPFYRVPLYLGFNVFRKWKIDDYVNLQIGFINGTFLPYTYIAWDAKMIRYDQLLKIDMEYKFDLIKEETNI
jgi:hypothetical protein